MIDLTARSSLPPTPPGFAHRRGYLQGALRASPPLYVEERLEYPERPAAEWSTAGLIMTQTLPFVEPRFMNTYGDFERAVYASLA